MADLPKNVLEAYFDASVNQESRTCESFVREVVKDDKGTEFVKYVPFDSADYQKSLGLVDLWSLNALLSAGVDPSFPVHTGFNSRIEVESVVNSTVESIVNESENSKN